MEFDLWTFGLQTVNFIILVWLLKIFLYGPVMAAIDRRQVENLKVTEKAQEVEKLAQSEIIKFKAKYEEIENARKKILADARVTEARAYDKLIQEGQEEVAKLHSLARKDIKREHHEAQIEIRQAAADLAVTLARHILEESRSSDLNELFLEKIIAHFNQIPTTEFNNIENHLQDGDVSIITAEKLDAATEKRWRKVIGSVFKEKANFVFSVDKSLIAGINIQFSNGLVGFNWRDCLNEFTAALYKRAENS